MKIYFPYTGPEMPSIVMSQIGRELGFNVDIEHLGRPKLRVAAPGLKGIPHQAYDVRLFPIGDRYRKFSGVPHPRIPGKMIPIRRVNGVCWHGHWAFMRAIFDGWENATIRSAIAHYYGETDFLYQTDGVKSDDAAFNRNATCKCPDL